jgi:hypothetical protein
MRIGCAILAFLMGTGAEAATAGEAPVRAAGRTPVSAPSRDAEVERLSVEIRRLATELAVLREQMAKAGQETDGNAGIPERLAALEKELVRLEAELRRVDENAQQTAAAVDGLSQGEQRRTSLTVYGDFQATAYRDTHPIFDGRAFELVLSGHPHKRLSFFGEIEFEQVAGVGGNRGGEIVVEQAFASLSFWSLFNLRAGIILIPFGNVNIDHFAPRRDVVTKPLVSYVVAPSDWTDNGVGIYGKKLLGASWLLSYEAYAVAGLGPQITGLGMRDARQGYGVDNNDNKALVGRLAATHGSGLNAGVSAYRGKHDDADRQILAGWAVDGLARLGPLTTTGEYNAFTAHRALGPSSQLNGYYVRATLDLGKTLLAHTPFGKDFDEPHLALVGQYDEVHTDGPVDGAQESNRERRQTVGLCVRPSSQWVLKVTYEWNQTTNRPLVFGDRDGFVGAIGFVF